MFTCTCAENLPGGQDSFRVIHRMEHGVIGMHDHEFHELALVHAGRGRHVRGGGREDALRRGMVIVMPEGSRHEYRPAGTLCVTNLLIGRRRLARLRAEFGPAAVPANETVLRLDPDDFARLEDLVARLALTQEAVTATAAMEAQGLLLQFVATWRNLAEEPSREVARARAAVAGALSLVDRKLLEPLDVATLASATELGGRTFLRVFQKATGYPPLDYVLRRRLARAADRLLADDAPVTEIAFACGFNDSNYFARQFRRVHGCPPSVFRARSRA